jgi:hypothetical protein
MPYFGDDEEHVKGVKKPFISESFGRWASKEIELRISESETPRRNGFQDHEMASTTVTPVPMLTLPNLTNTQ